jgi:hypothetical protein
MKPTNLLLASALAATVLRPALGRSQDDAPEGSASPTRSFAFSAGATQERIRDNYLSPVAFHGSLLSLGASYRSESPRARQSIELAFSSGGIDSATQPRDVRQYVGSASYAYLRPLRSPGGSGRGVALFAGAGASSFVAWTDFDATDPIGYTFYDRSWYWSHALDVQILAEYRFTGWRRLSAGLSSPALRLVSRPENGHDFNARNAEVIRGFMHAATGGSLVAPWENPVLVCQLEYEQPIASRFDLRIGYAFRKIASDTPLPMRAYANGLTASLAWNRGHRSR